MKQMIHVKCKGCEKIRDNFLCSVYSKPSIWWENNKHCPMATHIVERIGYEQEKKRIGQQKQKKNK